MRTELNEVTGIKEGFINGVLEVLPTEFKQENSKGTKYAIANVKISYPDNTSDVVSAIIYEKSANTGLFTSGGQVEIRVQLEGDYAGNAVVQLASAKRVDLTKFGIKVDAMTPALEA
jgi:Na+-translocating ferredoxin:NAD+ oxidoreductase RnfG subunit